MKDAIRDSDDGVEAIRVEGFDIRVASEAIVVVDIVNATATSDLFGWYAVGRTLIRELREMLIDIGSRHDLMFMKSTGDGFLLTYRSARSAEMGAMNAVQASVELLERLALHNSTVPAERQISIRIALHFGELDLLENDREGPNVAYAFRMEAVNRGSLPQAINPIEPDRFPLRNYMICSERVADILDRNSAVQSLTSCGLFKLKGFSGWSELFLVVHQSSA